MRLVVKGPAVVPYAIGAITRNSVAVAVGVVHGLRIGVGHAELQTADESTVGRDLQRVVVGKAGVVVIGDAAVPRKGAQEVVRQRRIRDRRVVVLRIHVPVG